MLQVAALAMTMMLGQPADVAKQKPVRDGRVYAPPPSPGQEIRRPRSLVIAPPPGDLTPVDPPPGGTRAIAIDPGMWVNFYDYPPDALRQSIGGRSFYRVAVSPEGRPSRCIITQSSGSASLDSRTCEVVLGRAQFRPARNAQGNAVAGDYVGIIRWQIPD